MQICKRLNTFFNFLVYLRYYSFFLSFNLCFLNGKILIFYVFYYKLMNEIVIQLKGKKYNYAMNNECYYIFISINNYFLLISVKYISKKEIVDFLISWVKYINFSFKIMMYSILKWLLFLKDSFVSTFIHVQSEKN